MDREADLLPILRSYGRCPTSFLALGRDKALHWMPGGGGVLAFTSVGRVHVVLGDPIASCSEAPEILKDFGSRALRRNCRVAAVAVTEEGSKAYEAAGYKGTRCGAEPAVDLRNFSLEGGSRRNLRRSSRHAARAGVVVEELPRPVCSDTDLADEFHRITLDWVRGRKTGLLSFIVGEPFTPGWQESRIFVARTATRIEAFAILYPVYPTRAVYVDITRRRLDSPNGTMDLLLSEALLTVAQDGVRRAYLGMVPGVFSDTAFGDGPGAFLRSVFKLFGTLYPGRTEFFFKQKFAPRWEPRYLFFLPQPDLRCLLAICRVLWPEGAVGILRHKLVGRAGS